MKTHPPFNKFKKENFIGQVIWRNLRGIDHNKLAAEIGSNERLVT